MILSCFIVNGSVYGLFISFIKYLFESSTGYLSIFFSILFALNPYDFFLSFFESLLDKFKFCFEFFNEFNCNILLASIVFLVFISLKLAALSEILLSLFIPKELSISLLSSLILRFAFSCLINTVP